MRDQAAPEIDRPAAAAVQAVWLADPERRRVPWASPTLLSMLGLADVEALRASPVHRALAAVAVSTGDLVLEVGGRLLHGPLATAAVVLPDGRLGVRAVWSLTPAVEEDAEAHLLAAAFEAAPLPLAIMEADGRLRAANAAWSAAGGLAALGASASRLPLPARAGCVLVAGPSRAVPAGGQITAGALARIAHEFRSPLTAVLGFAEFLRAGIADMPPDRAAGYLDDLASAAERMRRLADSLVALGNERHGLHIAEVALDPLLAAALRLVAAQAARRGIALTPAPSSQLRILADGDALSRAVVNLLDNAVRHAHAAVRLDVEDSGRDHGAAIIVADDGPGLSPSALETALRPYGRPEGGARTEPGGLGLAIVAEIAEGHGGTLEIDTAPGKGLSARLGLPPGRVFRSPPPC